jgi:hypothetical protein
MKCYVGNIALYDAETLTLRKADQQCLESFKNVAGEGRRTPAGSTVWKRSTGRKEYPTYNKTKEG